MGRASRSVLLACLLVAACEPPPPATPSAIDAATMNALLQRLDRLTAALEGTPRSAAVPARAPDEETPVPQRTPAAGDTAALLARIDALEAMLTVLQRTAPQGAFAPAPAFAAAAPPMRTQAVQQLREQLDGDQQQSARDTFRSLFLLGPAQVLDRFGTPSEVTVDGQACWWWRYEQGDRMVMIKFSQGVVIHVE